MISAALKLLFSFFPVAVAVLLLGVIAFMIIAAVFKLVKLVLDAIPFL